MVHFSLGYLTRNQLCGVVSFFFFRFFMILLQIFFAVKCTDNDSIICQTIKYESVQKRRHNLWYNVQEGTEHYQASESTVVMLLSANFDHMHIYILFQLFSCECNRTKYLFLCDYNSNQALVPPPIAHSSFPVLLAAVKLTAVCMAAGQNQPKLLKFNSLFKWVIFGLIRNHI